MKKWKIVEQRRRCKKMDNEQMRGQTNAEASQEKIRMCKRAESVERPDVIAI